MCTNSNQDLVKINAYSMQNLVILHQINLRILSEDEILTLTKGHNYVVNSQKLIPSNPVLVLINVNADAKFGLIPSIRSKDTEQETRGSRGP